MRVLRSLVLVICSLAVGAPAMAAGLAGRVLDRTGAVLPGVTVVLTDTTASTESVTTTDAEGAYAFGDLDAGVYRLVATLAGFSDASRTVVLQSGGVVVEVDFVLDLGTFRADVTVAAARGERDTRLVPIRADAIDADEVAALTPRSTGDALGTAPGVTPVGSGPFGIRPRLRGLDSTRVLVLVDGERLNNARTATDRAGVEVGLVNPDDIERIEVLGGAGSVLYGTDALSGTINILTSRSRFSPTPRLSTALDLQYSGNDNGRRATAHVGYTDRRWAVSFTGGVERYDDYDAGGRFDESSAPLLADGTLAQDDTADALGFDFGAFPDPFNMPFTRSEATVRGSGMQGSSASLSARMLLTPSQQIELRYQRRHADDIGFPDFEPPMFFQTIELPWSRLEKFSASYVASHLADWFPRLSVTSYYQHQDRLLRNTFPVQFPVPSPFFFPVDIFRLDITSETRQQVWTPGVDVQATLLPRADNVLTIGATLFRDRSEDDRLTTTTTSTIGNVDLGARGPQPTVYPAPIVLGPPETSRPVRVPHASFRDVAVFVHDEWQATDAVRVTGGLRLDRYRVTTEPTPGYDVASLAAGAMPAIDPATLPRLDGETIARTAFTGEAGVVVWSDRPVSLFGHYVRSYRHPNLEELLFSGPATAGNILPNVTVEPETGHNVDVGARWRASRLTGSASYFVNTYAGFISTEIVADSPAGTISQAINLADVRIQGLEVELDAPVATGTLLWTPWVQLATTRGTVLSGVNPLAGTSLDGAPQDNITPWKLSVGARVGDREERWWASWRMRAQGAVSRVSPLLADSPFLIAQDLFALDGFAVHRIAAGYVLPFGDQRLGLTVSLDNVADRFYREHFQFAPARGRTLTVAIDVAGIR